MSRFGAVVSLLLCLACACGRKPNGAEGRAASPAPTAAASPWPEPTPDTRRAKGSGKFNQHAFTFEQQGRTVTAYFRPPLPRVDMTVVGAARVVILEAYGEKMEGFPRPVRWGAENELQAIKLGGVARDYVFWPQTEEKNVIRKIIFWEVPKDSVK